MSKARKEIELAVRLGNEAGALGRVLALVAQHGVNILAYCAYSERREGVLLLVTDNPLTAKIALQDAGYDCRANSVVLVGATDQVGGAALLGARLGHAGIDILYSYASSAGGDQFFAVFKTSDDQRALDILAVSQAGVCAA
ncbi:MAG: hypothetical protein PCFJNLEI_03573 [Verrucomicrobiae bacterium]|nr:hypothetical protein [Verrucomicrobiae bacterium]